MRRGNVQHAGPSRHLTTALFVTVAQSLASAASAQFVAPGQNTGGAQAVPAGGAAVAAPGDGGAPRGDWRFTPSIGIDTTYSDNVNLAPAGSEVSDLVVTISPALRLIRYGPRLTATFNYNPQLLYYARGSNGVQVRNYLDASANADLIENFLFFDALVAISQGNVSPFGTLSDNTVNNSANRAETRAYSFGPTLRSRVGSDLTYSAGYRFTGSSSDNSAYAANRTSVLYGQFESGTSFRNLGYGVDASRNQQSYGEAGEIVQETVGTTLTYVLVPTFHLRGRIGYDRNSYPTTGQPDLKGISYSGGFDWQPSRRTQLNAQVGHRYFGPTANITFRESGRQFAINATYSRDQTTSAGNGLGLVANPNFALLDQFYRTTYPDPALRAQVVTATLQEAGLSSSQFATSTFLSNQLFVQKVARISVALLGRRNTVTFDAYRSEVQALSNIDTGFDIFNQAQQFRTTSFSANLSHELGPRTTVNVTAAKIHNQAIVGVGDTRVRLLTASVSRQIQRHLTGSVMVRNTQQSGQDNNGVPATNGNFYSGNYRENAVIGSLRLSFQ